jgi:hypothetical protein
MQNSTEKSPMSFPPLLFKRILSYKTLGTEKHKNYQKSAIDNLSHICGNGTRHT